MCGTAPSSVWYIQHLVQHLDLVQQDDLEPQEEQSWQQQNVEDTLNNYVSFFNRFILVKNGWEIQYQIFKPNAQNLNQFYNSTIF